MPQQGRACPYFVYVVHEVDDPSVCKVGIALNVAARFSSLQVGTWRSLRAAHTTQLPSERAAFAVEHSVHQALAPLHCRGEWFRVGPERAIAEVVLAASRLLAAFEQAASIAHSQSEASA